MVFAAEPFPGTACMCLNTPLHWHLEHLSQTSAHFLWGQMAALGLGQDRERACDFRRHPLTEQVARPEGSHGYTGDFQVALNLTLLFFSYFTMT